MFYSECEIDRPSGIARLIDQLVLPGGEDGWQTLKQPQVSGLYIQLSNIHKSNADLNKHCSNKVSIYLGAELIRN